MQTGDDKSGSSFDFEAIARQLASDLAPGGAAASNLPDGENKASSPAGDDFENIVISNGHGKLPKITLQHQPSSQQVEIYTYGAVVLSWKIAGTEHLWCSEQNEWVSGGKAIRGGIPLCFPQFGPYGSLVQHGFARISTWEISDTFVAEDGSVSAVLVLSSEIPSESISAWPHKFSAQYTVTLSNAGLETNFQVTNTDDKPFDFTMAFHNYIKTTDIADARIFGYEGAKYYDRLDNDKEGGPQEDTGAGVIVEKETDRIYLNTPEELALFDFTSLKVFKLKKTDTLPDATLWNPYGAGNCDPGWREFVCIEPACIAKPVKLNPGEKWCGSQLLGVE